MGWNIGSLSDQFFSIFVKLFFGIVLAMFLSKCMMRDYTWPVLTAKSIWKSHHMAVSRTSLIFQKIFEANSSLHLILKSKIHN